MYVRKAYLYISNCLLSPQVTFQHIYMSEEDMSLWCILVI